MFINKVSQFFINYLHIVDYENHQHHNGVNCDVSHAFLWGYFFGSCSSFCKITNANVAIIVGYYFLIGNFVYVLLIVCMTRFSEKYVMDQISGQFVEHLGHRPLYPLYFGSK